MVACVSCAIDVSGQTARSEDISKRLEFIGKKDWVHTKFVERNKV